MSAASRSIFFSASTSSDGRDVPRPEAGVALDPRVRGVRREDLGGVVVPASAKSGSAGDRGGVCVPLDFGVRLLDRDRGGVEGSAREGVSFFGDGELAFFRMADSAPLGTTAKGLRTLSGVPRGIVRCWGWAAI